jgi:hypothetical protein
MEWRAYGTGGHAAKQLRLGAWNEYKTHKITIVRLTADDLSGST